MKPSRILLCILSTFIVLAAVCAFGAGKSEYVRVPSLASVLGIDEWYGIQDNLDNIEGSDGPEISEVIQDNQQSSDAVPTVLPDSTPAKPRVVELPPSLPQTALYLPQFYASLRTAERQMVRVVHFGDSQIEEDRISMVLRRRLQDRFGGGGVGLIPMVQTIPTYTAKQSIEQDGHELPYSFIKRYLAYGPLSMRLKNSNWYGPMAQVAYVDQPVDVDVELLRDRVPTYAYDHVRVLCSDSVQVALVPDSMQLQQFRIRATVVDSTGETSAMHQDMLVLAEPRRRSLIRFSGKGYVYGLSLETATGVHVDNVPMRGAAGTNFTVISHSQFEDYFRETNTTLIILQFGGNAIPSLRTQAAVNKYVQSMRQQIQYIMSAAPNASLLFIGPSDMITTVDGEQMSYPMLPYLDKTLTTMVEEEGGAYYSLFRLMGGAGSMFSWRDKGLAGDDLIHFTRSGAKKVGEMLAKQLLEDYDSIIESQKPKAENTDTIDISQDTTIISQE